MKEVMRKVGSLLCAIAIVGVFGIADPMPLQAEEADYNCYNEAGKKRCSEGYCESEVVII